VCNPQRGQSLVASQNIDRSPLQMISVQFV
jgi:hypothetical protein